MEVRFAILSLHHVYDAFSALNIIVRLNQLQQDVFRLHRHTGFLREQAGNSEGNVVTASQRLCQQGFTTTGGPSKDIALL